MRRFVALSLLALVAVSACAARYPVVQPVTGIATAYDDLRTRCDTASVLQACPVGLARTVRCVWSQGAVTLRTDTLTVIAGSPFTFQPPALTLSTSVLSTVTQTDISGLWSCPAVKTQVPTWVDVRPAAVTLP